MNEMITLKAELLGGMDIYVRETIGDEDLTDGWNMYGVPDGADESDILEIASDDSEFRRICEYFGEIIKACSDDNYDEYYHENE